MAITTIQLHKDDFKPIIWEGLIESLVYAKLLDKKYIDGTKPIELLTLRVVQAAEGW